MKKRVHVDVTVHLVIECDEKVDGTTVVDEMDYNFTSTTKGAEIKETEISGIDFIETTFV